MPLFTHDIPKNGLLFSINIKQNIRNLNRQTKQIFSLIFFPKFRLMPLVNWGTRIIPNNRGELKFYSTQRVLQT